MKKLFKSMLVVACVGAICAGVACMSACGGAKNGTGEAYSLVHTADSVGYAKLVYAEGKIIDAVLTEVCLPTQVQATAEVDEADKVLAVINNHGTAGAATYYKTISFNNVTFTYDGTLDGTYSKGYMNGSQTLREYLKSEKNAKAYYEAVVNNRLIVKIGGEDKNDVLTKANLYKDENGYGGTTFDWKGNRDATVAYVKANGTKNLKKLTRNTQTNVWMDGNVSTGATWTDLLGSDADNKASGKDLGAITYAQLILNADKAVK